MELRSRARRKHRCLRSRPPVVSTGRTQASAPRSDSEPSSCSWPQWSSGGAHGRGSITPASRAPRSSIRTAAGSGANGPALSVRAAGLELSARQRDDPPTMPNCYVVISTNPRTRADVVGIVDGLAGDVGVAPGAAPIYFDYVRGKAHAFVPLQTEAQAFDLI